MSEWRAPVVKKSLRVACSLLRGYFKAVSEREGRLRQPGEAEFHFAVMT